MAVLVFIENWEGKFKKLSFELVSYGSKVAEMMGTKVVALSVGEVENTELEKLAKYGAGKIISLKNEVLKVLDNQVYSGIIADIAQKEGANTIILANNNTGKALAPRLSVRLKAGWQRSQQIPLSVAPFVVFKRVYSGNAYAHVVVEE